METENVKVREREIAKEEKLKEIGKILKEHREFYENFGYNDNFFYSFRCKNGRSYIIACEENLEKLEKQILEDRIIGFETPRHSINYNFNDNNNLSLIKLEIYDSEYKSLFKDSISLENAAKIATEILSPLGYQVKVKD
jgi:hypothetical protein